jgi:hypothetical protein
MMFSINPVGQSFLSASKDGWCLGCACHED